MSFSPFDFVLPLPWYTHTQRRAQSHVQYTNFVCDECLPVTSGLAHCLWIFSRLGSLEKMHIMSEALKVTLGTHRNIVYLKILCIMWETRCALHRIQWVYIQYMYIHIHTVYKIMSCLLCLHSIVHQEEGVCSEIKLIFWLNTLCS